jgi:RecA/RadA recombinase
VEQFAHAGHSCALVDASDCFDPMDAEAAGVELHRLLWIRCDQNAGTQQYKTKQKWEKIAPRHPRYEVYGYEIKGTSTTTNTGGHKLLNPLEQALKAADILARNGEFRLIAVDLRNIDWRVLRKVPFTT